MHAGTDHQVSSPRHKRARLDVSDGNISYRPPSADAGLEHRFIQDADSRESESGCENDEDDAITKPSDQKTGKRKVKIEYIQDRNKCHIVFSKRKAEMMKKAYELSILTGTQVLLLVVSETGDVHSFTTAKFEPLVTQPEGQNLIQAYLNAPYGSAAKEAVVVASVNRLPVEILSEVFLVCADTLDHSEIYEMDELGIPSHHHRLKFARNAVPYILSSVCKRWRSIGLSTPKLWSKFTIPYTAFHVQYSGREILIALRTWLKRSKNHPLQFTCLSCHRHEEEILLELFKNIHRWHITCFWSSHASHYLAQQNQWFGNDVLKAENCDTLEFNGCDDSLNIPFQQFPNLRRLRIHPRCLAVEEARSQSLTHLALTKLEGNTATFFSYLRLFPSLISFEAPVNELDHRLSHLPLTPFMHTTLTELAISQYEGGNVLLRNILTNIHLPSIHRLCLMYQCEFHETLSQRVEMADVVNNFIRRHESTFTDLELSGLQISSDEMIETLRMFPRHLTSYQCRLWDLTNECVKRLTLDPSDPTPDLAPNLTSIFLINNQPNTPSGDLLTEMILSRWARNPHTTFKLQTAYSGLNPLSDPRIARQLQHNPELLLFYDLYDPL